mgnify:CR=1 FL=1
MALSTVFSLDKILKEFYAGPIRDQLNNEMLVFELFNRRKMNWVGRRVIMPVRVSRNNSGAFAPDNGALPPAGQQGYADLTIPSKYLYGRMSITGPAIAQAKASVGAFVNGLQQELDGAVETVKNAADLACFTGGGAVGFVNDRAAAASTMPFSGNLEGLPGSAAPGIPCVVVRNDTYAVIAAGAAGALFVRQSATAGSAQFVTNLGAGNNLDLTGLAKGAAATVVILALDAALAFPTENQALGIYGNLGAGYFDAAVLAGAAPTHFGADRTTATGSTVLQSTIQSVENTVASAAPGAGARTPVDTKRMQGILDSIADQSGESPDCMIAHYIFRQEYTSLMSFTSEAAAVGIATSRSKSVDSGDPGFNMGALSFNGIPLKVARQCGKGLLIFLNLKSWVVAEVQAPGMADLDGSVLSREAGADAYEAFVRYYYNTVCTAPNRNGILTGISYAGV